MLLVRTQFRPHGRRVDGATHHRRCHRRWQRNSAAFATPWEFSDSGSKLQLRLFGSAIPRCGWVVAVAGIPTAVNVLVLRAYGHPNRKPPPCTNPLPLPKLHHRRRQTTLRKRRRGRQPAAVQTSGSSTGVAAAAPSASAAMV
jgi:hypothetical protein